MPVTSPDHKYNMNLCIENALEWTKKIDIM